jgi:hypothetical protein
MDGLRAVVLEAGFPEQVAVFIEWVESQHPAMMLRVLAYVNVVMRAHSGDLNLSVGIGGMSIPNVWAAGDAAARLRDLAASAGFAEVASIFDEVCQGAVSLIQSLEAMPV